MPGAKNAVETCLAVKPGEHVALIADEASRAVAASLAPRWPIATPPAPACCSRILARPLKAAPAPVLEALETADVGILCMKPQPGELGARMAIVKVVERRQIRYAHMVGVTPQIMQPGHARRLQNGRPPQRQTSRPHASRANPDASRPTPARTIAAHFDRGLDWVKTSGLISPRYWSNLPAGEVFTTPATVDGTFVCDATAGDHFNGKYGDLQTTPLTLQDRRRAAG